MASTFTKTSDTWAADNIVAGHPWSGLHKAYIMKDHQWYELAPSSMIVLKVGKKKIRLLYVFKRSVPIDPLLRFIKTASRIVQERYARNFNRALDDALRRPK